MQIKHLLLFFLVFAMSSKGIANTVSIKAAKRDWISAVAEVEKIEGVALDTATEIHHRNELINDEWRKRNIYFDLLSISFLKRNKTAREIFKEFNEKKNNQILIGTFTSSLIRSSISTLKKSKNLEIQHLMTKYTKVYGESSIPLFRLTGAYTHAHSPTEHKGGFHRGARSIFMDLERTDNNEFLFIFMHELYHALDEELLTASSFFSERDRFEAVMKLSVQHENLVELDPENFNLLDTWVSAGLNRNLFAEWRDWLFCFKVYKSGVTEGLWGKIPFVEEVLAYQDPRENLPFFVYRYLDERATLNEDSLMGRSIIKEMVEKKRMEFYQKLH